MKIDISIFNFFNLFMYTIYHTCISFKKIHCLRDCEMSSSCIKNLYEIIFIWYLINMIVSLYIYEYASLTIRIHTDRVFYVKHLSWRMMHLCTYHVLPWCIMHMNFHMFEYKIDKYLIQIPIQKITQLKFSTFNLLQQLISLHFKLVKMDKRFWLSSFLHINWKSGWL